MLAFKAKAEELEKKFKAQQKKPKKNKKSNKVQTSTIPDDDELEDTQFFDVPNITLPQSELKHPLYPYLEKQQEELIYLRSYFLGSMKESECFPRRISIPLADPKNWGFPRGLDLVLVTTFHPNYPMDSVPLFAVRSNAIKPDISIKLLEEMESFLNKKSPFEYRGDFRD